MSRLSRQETAPQDILDVLVSGCDERITLDPLTGANKYHLNPTRYEGLLQRGTCTAGTLNEGSKAAVEAFLRDYRSEQDGDANYEGLLQSQADRLTAVIGTATGTTFEVFFGSSGSDLAYYPALFQTMLNPGKRIVHIVSCPEELGSGSLAASEARAFSSWNQFSETLDKGELIAPRIAPGVVHLAARDDSGHILPRREQIEALIDANRDAAVVGSLVFGSKSGIMDDLEVISDCGEDVLWVVDLCQFRVDSDLISQLLAHGAAVMLTGSKFFGAPPFCAALLVPEDLCARLATVSASAIAPFGKVFSAYDVPALLENMRVELPALRNLGLRARWEAALDEMEAYSAWSPAETNGVIAEWNAAVVERLAASAAFTLMPDQDLTNDSIISMQIVGRDGELSFEQLGKLFEVVVTTEHEGFTRGRNRAFVGQPVRYGDRAFLRLALGSHAVRDFLVADKADFSDDFRLIEILEEQAAALYGT